MLAEKKMLTCLMLWLQLFLTGSGGADGTTDAGLATPAKQKIAEIPDNTILHLGHSANLMKIGGSVLVFDYPFGGESSEAMLYRLDPNELKDEKVYVFASHRHGDHFNSSILSWKDRIPRIKYILSCDILRRPDDAIVIRPGQAIEVDGIKVRAYPSTDAGVAFSVYLAGKHIYFSGDNGFWNWENTKSQEDYLLEALAPIDRSLPIDIAFQVCDPKADGKGEGGIGIFELTFQPRLLVPLHLRGDYEFPKKVEPLLKQRGFKHTFWAVSRLGESITFDGLDTPGTERKPADSLHQAAADGDVDRVKLLISTGADVNAKNADRRTPLHLAAALGGKDAVLMLVRSGADINAKDKNSRTPLHIAATAYKTDVVKLFVAGGADVNAKDQAGRTPLHVAVGVGADAIVEVLITGGADVNAKDQAGRTPLHLAAATPDIVLARLLIANSAEIDAPDREGATPLYLAVETNQKDLAQLLIEKGADVNAKDKSGRTPLHWAVIEGLKDMAEFLIAKGVDVNIIDTYGHTPLKIANLSKRTEIAAMLSEHGAKE